jgi:hypothetical protein
MTRIMRDSTTPTDIPVRGTELAAGYTTGKFAWSAAGYARFPGVPHVRIDCLGTSPEGSEILDVEPGCAGVSTAATWAKNRRAAFPGGYPPIIYCSRGMLPSLLAAMNAAGLRIVKDFRLWIATLDGTKEIGDMTGVIAVQHKRARRQKNGKWIEPPGEKVTRGHYDESIVYDDDWHPEDDLPYARKDIVGMVKNGVAEELRDPRTKREILNLVKNGVAAELRAASTREEVLNLVRNGVAAELQAGIGTSGVTPVRGAEAAVSAQEALASITEQLTELMRIVTGLQTATPPVTAPAAPGGADEPGGADGAAPPAQG